MMDEKMVSGDLRSWIGRSMSIEDEITLPAARRIAAMVDLDPSTLRHGDPIPPHWYSMFFTLNARRSQIGHDGHPRKGEFLPPVPLPRRMFVGRKVTFFEPLRIGDAAVKRSEIASIEEKDGRSGRLIFVTVRHAIAVGQMAAVEELQEVVYREAAEPGRLSAVSPALASKTGDWSESIPMDPVLVFRFSAVTWNGHRIHYDADYARTVEGYPGCVMNGGLTIHLLVDAALRANPGRTLEGLSARLIRPLFVGDVLTLGGQLAVDGRVDAWAANARGELAVSAELRLV